MSDWLRKHPWTMAYIAVCVTIILILQIVTLLEVRP